MRRLRLWLRHRRARARAGILLLILGLGWPALAGGAWVIQRPDGTVRACNQNTPDDALRPGEVWVKAADCLAVTVTAPAPTGPDMAGFMADLKAQFGTYATWNGLLAKHPLFLPALQGGDWPAVQDRIIAAHAALDISDLQYLAIKSAATTRRIPVTLP